MLRGPHGRRGDRISFFLTWKGENEMSWTTNQVTQNGNTTTSWVVTGGSLSTHDAVVLRPETGSSSMRINSITVGINPTSYTISVSVIGAGAMGFRFSAEQMD
jgi:hypothetical protein